MKAECSMKWALLAALLQRLQSWKAATEFVAEGDWIFASPVKSNHVFENLKSKGLLDYRVVGNTSSEPRFAKQDLESWRTKKDKTFLIELALKFDKSAFVDTP